MKNKYLIFSLRGKVASIIKMKNVKDQGQIQIKVTAKKVTHKVIADLKIMYLKVKIFKKVIKD